MSDQLDTKTGWLSPDQMENIRANVPLVYVDAVPVRVNSLGRVTHIGLLLKHDITVESAPGGGDGMRC